MRDLFNDLRDAIARFLIRLAARVTTHGLVYDRLVALIEPVTHIPDGNGDVGTNWEHMLHNRDVYAKPGCEHDEPIPF